MKFMPIGQRGMKTIWLCALFTWVLVAGISEPAVSSDQNDSYENSAVLKASDILPPDVLSGPEHRVETNVKNDGFLNHYVLQSTYGTYEVVSDLLLKKRVHEIYAIKEMKKISTAGTLEDSAISSGEKTVEGLGSDCSLTDMMGEHSVTP